MLLEILENLDLFNFLNFPASVFVVVDIGELCPEPIPEELVLDSLAKEPACGDWICGNKNLKIGILGEFRNKNL